MSDPEPCVFCAIVDGRAPAHVVRSDERTIAFLDINPATSGHTLVVPRVPMRARCSTSTPPMRRR